MTTTQPAAPRTPVIDQEPTTVDLFPWHLGNPGLEGFEDEVSTTGVYLAPPRPGSDPDQRQDPRTASIRALARRPAPRVSEIVEALALPPDLHESMLPVGARPRGELQVRIAMIRVVRELGREYRERRGCILRTDAAAIEVLQRHLLACAAEVLAGRMDARALATEVARHGALFGEILARRLEATWVDVSGEQPGHWQMMIPPATLVSPIARVHRFLLQRNREQDLVGFFLDLDAASRNEAHR